jgi:hypothetical protein
LGNVGYIGHDAHCSGDPRNPRKPISDTEQQPSHSNIDGFLLLMNIGNSRDIAQAGRRARPPVRHLRIVRKYTPSAKDIRQAGGKQYGMDYMSSRGILLFAEKIEDSQQLQHPGNGYSKSSAWRRLREIHCKQCNMILGLWMARNHLVRQDVSMVSF